MKQVAWHEAGGGVAFIFPACVLPFPFRCHSPACPPPPMPQLLPPGILPVPSSHLNQLSYIPTPCQAHSEFSVSLHSGIKTVSKHALSGTSLPAFAL